MCGRDRVRAGQPGVEGHHPCLGAHPDDRRERDRHLDARAPGDRARAVDGTGMGGQEDGDPGSRSAQVGDGDVDEDGSARGGVTAPDQDHRRGQQRHQLPSCEEGEGVPGAEDAGKGERERAGQDGGRPAAHGGLEVTGGEEERRRCGRAEGAEEEARQGIEAESRLEGTGEGSTGVRPGCERPETGEREHCRAAGLKDDPGTECAARGSEDRPERDHAEAGDQYPADHSASSSFNSDCSPARRRVMIARPASSRAKT